MTGGGSGKDSRRHRRGRSALTWMLGTLVVGLVIVGLLLVARPQTHEAPSAAAAGAPAGLRVVQLTTAPDAASNDRQTIAVLLGGAMPHGTVKATVTTDENCAPDAQGYSHCRNDLRLADGSVLHLRHNHPMGMVACLAPGEEIMVRGA
jgi:hypothetical protein